MMMARSSINKNGIIFLGKLMLMLVVAWVAGFGIGYIAIDKSTETLDANLSRATGKIGVKEAIYEEVVMPKDVGAMVTVSNAGVKGQMGTVCYKGFRLDHPGRFVAIGKNILKWVPCYSFITLSIPAAPFLDGDYFVVDRSCMDNGVEIYITNPNEVVLGGCWKGFITKIMIKK